VILPWEKLQFKDFLKFACETIDLSIQVD
jgi:hypothetical protein